MAVARFAANCQYIVRPVYDCELDEQGFGSVPELKIHRKFDGACYGDLPAIWNTVSIYWRPRIWPPATPKLSPDRLRDIHAHKRQS